MRIIHRLSVLLRSLFFGQRVDTDLTEELRFHIDREIEANVARGMSPDAARRAARLTFGSVDAVQETSRDDRAGSLLRQMGRDLRFGARLLAKSPVFGITAIAIVALGIGAATAIFSVVYGVLLRPLPFRDPARLASISAKMPALNLDRAYVSAADARELRQLTGLFEDIALVRNVANLNLVGEGDPERLQGARVSPNLLSVLGVMPALGRPFARDEDQVGREHVVLLSDRLWRRKFGADPGVVGRKIQLNGEPHTVVGVMRADFQYPSREFEAWVPLVLDPLELSREKTGNYLVVARLAPGASVAQARGDLAAIARRLENSYPGTNKGVDLRLDPMLDDAVRGVRPALHLLLGAVGLLLLIACVNLTNLFSARAQARAGEFAVRLALGASRPRLIAQAIAEAAPMLLAGGVLGVTAAIWTVRSFVAAAPAGLPRAESIEVGVPVLVFSSLILILTGIAVSVAPVIQAWGSDFTTITKDGGRASTAGRRRATSRSIAVAAQIAFALPLLVGASLLIRSAVNVMRVDLGFSPAGVASFSLAVPRTKYPTAEPLVAFYSRLLEAVRAVPGVANAGLVNRLPLSGSQINSVGFATSNGATTQLSGVDTRAVTPDYFATMGIALRAGRGFTEHDDANAPRVGIIDERIAQKFWPGESAVGKRYLSPDNKWGEIIGVVAHVHNDGLDVDPRSQVYWSYRQVTQDRMVLVVRAQSDPRALLLPVIKAIRSVDPEQPVYDVGTMTDVVERSLVQRRLTMTLIAAFGGVALLLAAVGVYGVVAYGVTQRLREFAIRMALGATQGEVTQSVVRHGAWMAIAGSLIGLFAAIALSGAMSNLVYGVAPRDLLSFAGATGVLVFVTALASYIPARRAARIDPAVALRAE